MLGPLSGISALIAVGVGTLFCEICAGYSALFREYGVGGGGMEEPCPTAGIVQMNYNPT